MEQTDEHYLAKNTNAATFFPPYHDEFSSRCWTGGGPVARGPVDDIMMESQPMAETAMASDMACDCIKRYGRG